EKQRREGNRSLTTAWGKHPVGQSRQDRVGDGLVESSERNERQSVFVRAFKQIATRPDELCPFVAARCNLRQQRTAGTMSTLLGRGALPLPRFSLLSAQPAAGLLPAILLCLPNSTLSLSLASKPCRWK